MGGHPTNDQIRRFLDAQESRDSRRTALHVLRCEVCRQAAARELRAGEGDVELLAKVLRYPSRRAGAAPSNGASAAAERRLLARLDAASAEIEASGPLLEELRRHPLERWPLLLESSSRFHSLALARDIVQAGHRLGYDEPHRGAAMARLGIELVDRLDAAFYGQRLLDDVRGRGWAVIGDCQRVAGDLRGAEAAFRRARRLLEETADPEESATYLYLLGILRKEQRRFPQALRLYREARRLSEEIGDREKVARILTSLGGLHMERGEPEEALPALIDALAMVDAQTDSRIGLYARINTVLCLIELGDHLGARELLEQCREQLAAVSDSYVRLRARWLEGRIAAGLDESESAEEILSQVHSGYLARDQHYNASLVSLDLAALYARQGRSERLKALAEEMTAVFLAQDVPAEAMAALAFFRQAVEQERATEELVGGVASFLQRVRVDPGLKFRR